MSDFKTLIVETSYGEAMINFEVLKTSYGTEFNTFVLFAQDRVVICKVDKKTKEHFISEPIDILTEKGWKKVKVSTIGV